MIGYAPNDYRLWKSDERKVVIARGDIFYYDKFYEKEVCYTEVKSFEKEENVNNEYEIDENQEEEILENCANKDNDN